MNLTRELKLILEGKKGRILKECLANLIKYGEAMGAKDFVSIKSVHTSFNTLSKVARAFSPRGRMLEKSEIESFVDELSHIKVKVKTTINGGILDRDNWEKMGARKEIVDEVRRTEKIALKCGIMPTYSVIPYQGHNIPLFGDHCSWSESSAILYINSFLGARTNRDVSEISLYSAFLGITPRFGMHLKENRHGTDLIKVTCQLKNISDWGALGYFAGDKVGVGVPVIDGLDRRPTSEGCIQLCGGCSSSGPVSMIIIPGVSPEAPNLKEAFEGHRYRSIFTFDEQEKRNLYHNLSYNPQGKVDLVFLGCPYKTLYEIAEIAKALHGKRVAEGTRLWISTSRTSRSEAEALGYIDIIREAGGEVYADGCPVCFYVNSPIKTPLFTRIALDSAKQAFSARRSFQSNIFFGSTENCIEVALRGEVVG